MKKNRWIMSFLWLAVFLLIGCTVDVAQSPSPTAPNALPLVVEETLTPEAQPPGQAANNPGSKIAVTWSGLNLSGKLIFISALHNDINPVLEVQQLDLVSGDLITLFKSPDLSWIYSSAVTPDGKKLVICYTPPADENSRALQTLFQLPLDGSGQLQELIPPTDPLDQYLQPEWSPDGKYLYYSHVNYKSVSKTQPYPEFGVYRMAIPDGVPEKIADHSFWPRISRDGTRLVYISSDIMTGKNKIYVADPDGKNAREVQMSGAVVPDILDAPIFSADGQSIMFSAPVPAQAAEPTWLERALGITVAEAHSVPSEWWSVPVSGGAVTQLTNLQFAGLFASISPDGEHIASYSDNGLFVMSPSMGGITMILPDLGGIYGTVSWVP